MFRRSVSVARRVVAPRLRGTHVWIQPQLLYTQWIKPRSAIRLTEPARRYTTHSSLYLRTHTDLPPQLSTMDAPYPVPGSDGFVTLSFYSFFSLQSIQTTRSHLQAQWEALGIVGRVYVSNEGINAQLSVPFAKIIDLREWLEHSTVFRGRISRFNWALEHSQAFKALHVRVRPLVAAGVEVGLDVLANEPEYVEPKDWGKELDTPDALVLDMRNTYEYRVGRFDNAVCPDVDTFREELDQVRTMCSTRPRDAPILMYCTGGIRCSVAGAVLRGDGLTNVKTLRGGVIAYGQHVRKTQETQESRFRGKNFTFDKRRGEVVTSEILAKCDQCGSECDTFVNCAHTSCNLLFIQCPGCAEKHKKTCGRELCVERAQLSHEERVKQKLPPQWSHRERVRPELVFRDGVAHNPLDN
ncbi:hypothetical protein H4S00_002799 [Coemansia sp. D1744]|nr:hypothetical protein IWW46_000058 [Coemansia sp. RSA 2440]KAJ2722174.1 hypothetical protein H4S00_002799 [Coemansia sp. D1744]